MATKTVLMGCRPDLAVSPDDRYLYVADAGAVRVIDQENNNAVTTLAGSGTMHSSTGSGTKPAHRNTCGTSGLRYPLGISISTDGTALFLAGYQCNNVVKVMVNGGAMTEIGAFTSIGALEQRVTSRHPLGIVGSPMSIVTLDANHVLVFVSGTVRRLYKLNIADGTKTEIISYIPSSAMTISADRSTLFMNDGSKVVAFNLTQLILNQKQQESSIYDTTTSQFEMVIAGGSHGWEDGVGTNAQFHSIMGVIPTADSSTIFVADHWYGVIRKIECQN